MKYTVLFGRILFSLIFVVTFLGHFSEQVIGYAASQGVPLASITVPLSGVIALLGASFSALDSRIVGTTRRPV